MNTIKVAQKVDTIKIICDYPNSNIRITYGLKELFMAAFILLQVMLAMWRNKISIFPDRNTLHYVPCVISTKYLIMQPRGMLS